MFPLGADETPYRKLTGDHVTTAEFEGETVVKIAPEALTLLTQEAFRDSAHLLRPGHLQQLRAILDDPDASDNDRFVALDLLKNANIAAGGVLPMCQDTGTAIVSAKKGRNVWTPGGDEQAIARGIFRTYTESHLRYSQVAPLTMFEERNTGSNLPAQIDIQATDDDSYKFLFIAKGGGSANKTFLFQQTPGGAERRSRLLNFLDEKIAHPRHRGLPALSPGDGDRRHVGGAQPEDSQNGELPIPRHVAAPGRAAAVMPSATAEMEDRILGLTREMGIGAQFGGRYFCHDVRVIRLPRHGASVPIGLGVSCSADRQVLGKITRDGVFLEQLEMNPAQYLPEVTADILGADVVQIDLTRPMAEILATLSRYPVETRLSLTGPMIVARDLAHAKLKARLDSGEDLPGYFKDHPIYYAGPAKTPEGYASGSFGPTTAGRMDSYVDQFQAAGGSMVMLAKGNRSRPVVEACKRHGGFYLGSIGGPAARLAQDCIKKVECIEYPELGMEAIWRIEVEDFPAFIVTDDKGHDFFDRI